MHLLCRPVFTPRAAGVEAELGRIITARGPHAFATALHCGVRAPRAGMALRLAAAMSAIGVGGAGGTVSSNPAAATLRALGATLAIPSPRGGLANGVLPPSSAELLLGFLTLVEEGALGPVAAVLASPQAARSIAITVAHITPVATAATSGMDPAAVAAAWGELRQACVAAGSTARASGLLGDSGAHTLALHWLHQVLLQAFHVCQGSPQLLSPLSLRTSEAGRLVAFGAGGVGGGPGPWTAPLADTLLAVVREAAGGCRLLLAAAVRVVADLKQVRCLVCVWGRNDVVSITVESQAWLFSSGHACARVCRFVLSHLGPARAKLVDFVDGWLFAEWGAVH